ncbi:unnamed protein product, partial [Gulo gulo]
GAEVGARPGRGRGRRARGAPPIPCPSSLPARGAVGPRATGAPARRPRVTLVSSPRSSLTPARSSWSFAGAPGAQRRWMAEAQSGTGQLQEQKKGLLIAVSASVDKIISHFGAARNLVQKVRVARGRPWGRAAGGGEGAAATRTCRLCRLQAQLGDSR